MSPTLPTSSFGNLCLLLEGNLYIGMLVRQGMGRLMETVPASTATAVATTAAIATVGSTTAATTTSTTTAGTRLRTAQTAATSGPSLTR